MKWKDLIETMRLLLPESNMRDDLIVIAEFFSEFLETLRQKVLEDSSIGIHALSQELNVSPSTMKLALNEDL